MFCKISAWSIPFKKRFSFWKFAMMVCSYQSLANNLCFQKTHLRYIYIYIYEYICFAIELEITKNRTFIISVAFSLAIILQSYCPLRSLDSTNSIWYYPFIWFVWLYIVYKIAFAIVYSDSIFCSCPSSPAFAVLCP